MNSVSAHKTGGAEGSREGDLRLGFQAGIYQPSDYWTIARWWTLWGLPLISPEDIPSGVVVRLNGALVAAGVLYKTGMNLALFEWATVDPSLDLGARDAALTLLNQAAYDMAKSWGVKRLFTFSSHKKWVARLKNSGWTETETGCSQLVRGIQ